MFELVAAIQICIQNWKTFPMILTRKFSKIKHRIEHHRRLLDDIESTMNPFFPTTFLPKTLSRKLHFCLLTLMSFNALEFKADFKNRIFYALNIMYQYRCIFISNFTHVAALVFELLLPLHVAVCTLIFAANHNTAVALRTLLAELAHCSFKTLGVLGFWLGGGGGRGEGRIF